MIFSNPFLRLAKKSFLLALFSSPLAAAFAQTTDPIAERMVIYQRSYGGWPKAINEKKVVYEKEMSPEEIQSIRLTSNNVDATFDNKATSREVRYLVKAYKETKNDVYLKSAKKGVDYILTAQYKNGGWPQYYPDARLYRAQITYNDDAMVNVLNILQDIAEKNGDFAVFEDSYVTKAKEAVAKGVSCILQTQVNVNGKPTVWAAQYDEKKLVPAKARAFEPASLSSSESVGITRFLMRIKDPSIEVKNAITAAMSWFDNVKQSGINTKKVEDAALPKGYDIVVVEDPASTLWARFYDIKTQEPVFSDRTQIVKKKLSEIEYERRVGYAWYGVWPKKLIEKEFPAWKKLNGVQ